MVLVTDYLALNIKYVAYKNNKYVFIIHFSSFVVYEQPFLPTDYRLLIQVCVWVYKK